MNVSLFLSILFFILNLLFFIETYLYTMFEGQRLNYIVPGYTGHIPKKTYDGWQPIDKKQGTSHIPGYAGYVHSIKPQNIYAQTFGKITYDVNNNNYIKGQDVPAPVKFVSTTTNTIIPPSQMLRRTAADIVGVPNKKIDVREPNLTQTKGPETNQFKETKAQQFKRSVSNPNQKWINRSVVQKEGKQYVQLGNPLPGYTGFGKRVLANNVFGKTFAQCRKDALRDADKLDHEKKKNFQTQLSSQPPLKF